MSSLFIRDIDLIRHNNKEIILMKLNGEIIYSRHGFYVEFKVNNNLSGQLLMCLPVIYSDSSTSSQDGYTRIEIIKNNGTTTSNTATYLSQIKKVKLWYPKETYGIMFVNPDVIQDDDSYVGPLAGINYINTSNFVTMNSMFYFCNDLPSLDLSNFDTSNVIDMCAMFAVCRGLTTLDVSSFNTSKVNNMSAMFAICDGLTSLDLSNFDTRNVTDMNQMFITCNKLTSLDLSSFKTGNVKNMSRMFYDCNKLTTLDLNNFNTSSVMNMSQMFAYCYGLTALDLSNFNTMAVDNMSEMFLNCTELKSLDVSKFDTTNVTDMNGMFKNCYGLISLPVNGFKVSKVTDMSHMFYNCWNLTELDLSSWVVDNDVYMTSMFAGCSKLKTIKGINNLAKNGLNKNGMFTNCKALESLDFSGWTHSHGSVDYMFSGCSSLKELNLCDLEIDENDDAISILGDCHALHTLRLDNCGNSTIRKIIDSETFPTGEITTDTRIICCKESNATGLTAPENWHFIFIDTTDTYYVGKFKNNRDITMVNTIINESHTNLSSMFENCTKLEFVYTGNWDTSNVTNMASMFYYCLELKSLDVNNINTANVTDMNNMFYNCWKLKTLDLSSWDVGQVTNMNYMFSYCSWLHELNLSSWNPVSVTKMSGMFSGCSSLKTLNLGGWDMSESTGLSSVSSTVFSQCSALENFEPPKNIDKSMNLSPCTELTHESLMKIINNLAPVETTKTLSLSTSSYGKLSDSEVLIATSKGWTINVQ